MEMKRVTVTLATILALGSGLVFSRRALKVQPRLPANNEQRVDLVIGSSAHTRF